MSSNSSQRYLWWRVLRLVLVPLVAVPVIVAGSLATLHIAGRDSAQPLVRFVAVEGRSMLPTYQPGEALLFVRRPWQKDSVVLADVGEDKPIVKRVEGVRGVQVLITGDNREVTATYLISPERIIGTLFARTGVHFTPPPETAAEQLEAGAPGEVEKLGGP
jgi:signal peptidase I